MEEASKKILGSITISHETVKDAEKYVKDVNGFGKKIKEYTAQNTTDLLDLILFGAINLNASDIHIEPQENQTRLRIRIDGLLQDVAFLEQNIYYNLLSRIKSLSKLKLNVTESPQDGRFSIELEKLSIEIRTSSLPAEYGEAIVMRVLDPKNLMNLEALGLRKDLYKVFQEEIKRPNGMIVITGPTGAGKTTTAYAFLMKIQNPEIKIITIEDPIEYHLTAISQTQVAPEKGYNFAEGLKSIVRQDPDVILVGEIRDLETAKIALEASLTGQLVLSTMHTNDAAGIIPRLVDIGVDISSIASGLKMAVAQRLVRKVCKECSSPTKPSASELSEIKKALKNILVKIDVPSLPKNTEALNEIKIIKETKGCKACNFTGYKGRKGVFEVFLVDTQMEKFILTNPPVSSIKELLVKKGMVTMYQSGLIEVVLGETTLQEVKKVAESD